MSKSNKFKTSSQKRQYRRFSDDFKRKKVREIEEKRSTISELSKAYEVSTTSIRKWINKYGTKEKPERTIVESKSDTRKIIQLQKRIADLERLVGQKQIEITFKDKMIELAEKEYNINLKKN